MQRKILNAMKPPRGSLDYILVPREGWFHSQSTDEIYEFDEDLFRAHQRAENEFEYRPFSSLKTPPNDIKTIEEIEQSLARRNKKRHQQIYEDKSPPTVEPIASLLGPHGDSPTVKELLEGTYDVDSLNAPDNVKQWLKWMKMTPAERKLHPVTPIITPKDFANAFKVVDKMISLSSSGLHYTLWKAIAEDEKFCKYMAVMMSLPFQYGFTNKRWERAIDVMLEKKSGEQKIHLMRIIGLVKADFNTALKLLFTQRLMTNSELAGLFSNQWGGRANRSAPDCATRKLISWKNARYMKTTAASFFDDLASCFDRMPTSI
ncbi:hypothetical protein ACHAWF_010493 [Thalassiosira exigua]